MRCDECAAWVWGVSGVGWCIYHVAGPCEHFRSVFAEVSHDGTQGATDELRRVERVLKLAQGDGVESGGAAAGQTADEQTHPGESENGVERVEVLHFEPVSHCVVRGRVASVTWGEMRMVEEVESDAN